MQIKRAVFEISNSDVSKCPKERIPEYAFIGRSNVGKSSLINMLTNQKKLAKTSGTPGKTQLINHFRINDNWFLVDLPGYGYARVSKKVKRTFQSFIKNYFSQREQLICSFVLIDSRHEPQRIDMDFMQFLGENQIPFCIIFTKADKLSPTVLKRNIATYKEKLLADSWDIFPDYFVTSSTSHEGRDQLLAFIGKINEDLRKSSNE
ncbi:ribosome biogenesis GTP-binding protein YihA/YsxC [Flavicella sediminum]|uniref:ribosome biogenesis GTP-binding protein YihA/YsxC n=1 Tax=Flavicella sediminum TaxID=2585141 RepID=UPI0011217AE9|nr:ribosome biogenesis GTP-binding protein YihA/YsxC [Flavicella sediminum]